MAELTLKLKDREIKTIPITKREVVIGRDPENELFIDNIGISRSHARIILKDDYFVLYDNGSSNGTFVNNQKVSEHRLAHGDEIQIGKYKITFSGHGDLPMVAGPPRDPAGAKVKNVIGTLQFSPDDIQRLLEADKEQAQKPVEPQSSEQKGEQLDAYELFERNRRLMVMMFASIGIIVVLILVLIFTMFAK
jgi:pSer/pThr/pTyr-binding forkhead associated (FHA) protein